MTTTTTVSLTIDPADNDRFIRLDCAGSYVPGRPHRATLWRWALRGVTRRGQAIYLRTTVAGARRYTTRAWIDEFLAACSDGNPSLVTAPAMTPAQRRLQARAAMDAIRNRPGVIRRVPAADGAEPLRDGGLID